MEYQFNILKAKEIANKLKTDKKFYLQCSNTAKQNYKEYFHEDQFNTTVKKQLKIS